MRNFYHDVVHYQATWSTAMAGGSIVIDNTVELQLVDDGWVHCTCKSPTDLVAQPTGVRGWVVCRGGDRADHSRIGPQMDFEPDGLGPRWLGATQRSTALSTPDLNSAHW